MHGFFRHNAINTLNRVQYSVNLTFIRIGNKHFRLTHLIVMIGHLQCLEPELHGL